MNLNEYQARALRTRGDMEMEAVDRLILSGLGLAGESGEYADEVKKIVYHGKLHDQDKLLKELGDILWYVAYAADINGVRLQDIAERNLEKLRKRYPEGFTPAASHDRKDAPEKRFTD